MLFICFEYMIVYISYLQMLATFQEFSLRGGGEAKSVVVLMFESKFWEGQKSLGGGRFRLSLGKKARMHDSLLEHHCKIKLNVV